MGNLRPKKTAQVVYEGESKQESVKMKQLALKMANKVVFDFMTHFQKNSSMGAIVEQIITIYCDAYVNFISTDDLGEAEVIFDFI